MDYEETIAFLFRSLPMYQRIGKPAYKANLNNTLALDEYFGHPHRAYPGIHIAGTNGKGSVGHMLSAVLQSAGYRTGLYTSPHLKDFRERIRINGDMIPKEKITAFVNDHKGIIDRVEPSFFEMSVAMAFDHFRNEEVDIAIIETGMGGRLDSTNIVHPLLSIITNIGMDHSQFLGDTLYKIAREKAGIIKKGVPLVVGQTQEEISVVFERKVKEMETSLHYADQAFSAEYSLGSGHGSQFMQVYRGGEPHLLSLEVDLMGLYQQNNVLTVLQSLEILADMDFQVKEEQLRAGLANTRGLTGLRGRWEIMGTNPLTICDTAHNPEGLRIIMKQISQMAWKNLHIILGMVDDKDPQRLLAELPREARYYFTQSSIPRAMDREKLAREAMKAGLYGKVCGSPKRAVQVACEKALPEDLVFVAGSTFLVAEVLD